jgi:outer membrane protein assembly factor BamB
MKRSQLRLSLSLCFFTATTMSIAGPGHQPVQYIGYHHDGSGVFRDCTPVSTWNEWDFKEVVTGKDERGKEQKAEVPDKERRVNIVWKVPHYNWCNGGMIIVGGKLFAMSDRGGFGFYADRPAEFAGAELFCHDPATGKLLWKTDLDHWDLVPNGAELRTLLLDYNKRQTEVYRAWAPLGLAMRARASGAALTEERYQQLSKPVRALIPDLPADLASLKGTVFDSTGYEQLHFFGKILPKYFPDLAETRKKLQAAGYLLDPWGGKYDPLGISMQTPVSDGKYIYVHTSYGGVFCVDLTGKIVWKRWQGAGWERAAAIPSPVLSGDLLHIIGVEGKSKDKNKLRIAVNKADGKTVWTAPFRGSYQTGPVVLDLPIAGDLKNRLTVLVFQGDGSVLRAKDGKELLTGLPAAWNGRPIGVDGDIVVLNNKSADGGGGSSIKNDYDEGWAAVRLTAPNADTVKAEVLWQGKKMGWGNVVARDGVVFHHARNLVESFDIRTGEQLGKATGTMVAAFHFPILAGDYLFGLEPKGFCGVAQVSADGRTLKVIGNSRLGDRVYGGKNSGPLDMKFSYGCQMFASGNRIFIRSMTDLYCLGNPAEALRLSKEHQ